MTNAQASDGYKSGLTGPEYQPISYDLSYIANSQISSGTFSGAQDSQALHRGGSSRSIILLIYENFLKKKVSLSSATEEQPLTMPVIH